MGRQKVIDKIYLADTFNELLDILDNIEQDKKIIKARNLTSHAFIHTEDEDEDEELSNIKEQVIEILESEVD